MSDEHKHGHDDHDHDHEPVEAVRAPELQPDELDTAGKSLSDALRISFIILKVIMVVLVIGFVASGFRTIESGEKGLVLRFGQIHRIKNEPGWLWVFPYPIDELIRIPVDRRIALPINTFWYKETREDILGQGVIPRNYFPEKLNPLQEGYCLTRSEEYESPAGQEPNGMGAPTDAAIALAQQNEGSDYSIVHTRWQIDYQIENIDQFYRNVYVPEARPGEVYFDVMTQSITPMLRSIVEDGVVNTMVQCTIDEALQSIDTIPRRVQQFVQQKLRSIDSGIRVTSVRLVRVEWPKQVDQAFQESITASQKRQEARTQARTYAENTLNEVAGRIARQLYGALVDPNATPDEQEYLWSQVAGQTRDRIAQAEAYKTKVVETAKANADYLLNLLPEYRKRPELVAQGIYLTAIENILAHAVEKFVVQPAGNTKGHEIRILVNRNPVKPKQQNLQTTR
jgi:membrane protease subunit HflK